MRRTHLFNDAVAALEEIPKTERKAAQLFYLEGFTIAEIAARSRCAEGTVKRRLFQARARLRQSFGISVTLRGQCIITKGFVKGLSLIKMCKL